MPRLEIIDLAPHVRVIEEADAVVVQWSERPVLVAQEVTGLQGPPGPQGSPGTGIDTALAEALNDPPDMTLIFENGLV